MLVDIGMCELNEWGFAKGAWLDQAAQPILETAEPRHCTTYGSNYPFSEEHRDEIDWE